MKAVAAIWIGLAVFLVCADSVNAAGTAAGAVINNTATVSFEINGVTQPQTSSNAATFTVLEVINVVLTQYGASVPVNSPDSNDALTFVLTNTGNGSEPFSLTRNNAIGGDSYDPANGSAGSIYFESGTQLGFQTSGPNADTLYIPGANDPNLAADQSRIVYVVSDTPGSLATGATGIVRLTAASLTPGAAAAPPGTGLPGQGDGGIEAVVGTGQANRDGTYIVSGLTVSVAKTVVSIVDSRGGASFEPGATITYRVVVTLSGSGTAANLAVNDPLPAELTYVPGSITVGGAARTDGLDADNASFSAGTVSVNFGNSVGPAALPAIEFRASLN